MDPNWGLGGIGMRIGDTNDTHHKDSPGLCRVLCLAQGVIHQPLAQRLACTIHQQ
jgi:hypothetical protein